MPLFPTESANFLNNNNSTQSCILEVINHDGNPPVVFFLNPLILYYKRLQKY